MYQKRSTIKMKERTYYTTHLLYDSVQTATPEDSLRRMQFSHFIDSMPFSRFDVRKNKNGRVTRVKVAKNDINRQAYKRRKDLIAEYDYLPGFNKVHWYRKNDDLRLIKMKDQFVPPVDSSEMEIEVGEFVADDFVSSDTLSIASNDSTSDSTRVAIAPPKEEVPAGPTERYRFGYEFKNNKFNEDQDYYNKEFGHLFVYEVPPPKEEPVTEESVVESDTTQTKKKGFFSKLKRKRNNEDEDEESADSEIDEANDDEEPPGNNN